MPRISVFFGIVIQMYWRDHNPPHVHAEYQGQEATFEIRTGVMGDGEIHPKAARLVREWLAEHEAELLENWERGRLYQPFKQVPGADN